MGAQAGNRRVVCVDCVWWWEERVRAQYSGLGTLNEYEYAHVGRYSCTRSMMGFVIDMAFRVPDVSCIFWLLHEKDAL